ncbi:scavenger receptor cysteine-rich domain-containing group B protein [Aplochiton taeniatus]
MQGQRVVQSVRGRWTPGLWLLVPLLGSLLLVAVSVLRQPANNTEPPTETLPTVRLVNGRKRCEGRVEVQHNRTWGTVCDDDWDMVDANVVCRQLECGLAMAVGSSSQFGQGSGPILLDNVDCKGGETDLGKCGSLGWGVHNCYHYEDVSVTCKDTTPMLESRDQLEPTTPLKRNSGLRDGTIRLVGGLDYCQGRVEVYYRGSWGTVCDDDWGERDAGVVCQQIGCGQAVAAHTNAYFGYGTGLILLDNVNCNGNEPQLSKCYSLGWGTHNCGHHEDAGVSCSVTDGTIPVTETTSALVTTPMTTQEPQIIRVVNGNSTCQGRVEVQHNSVWGTVCDDDWDIPNANVVCKQLGCGPALEAKVLAYFGYGSGPILMDNVDCQGNEESLTDCFNLGWGQHNCGHHEDAGVICARAIRLAGGQHSCEGRVEMFSGTEWGTVCDDAWDIRDAQVVCRQLGCGEATAARQESFFGPGNGIILLDNLKCSGAEVSLQTCSHIGWNVHNCDHSEDAGVTCSLS